MPDDRARLGAIAYRLLGSVADAEEAVQETYLRWYALSREQRAGIDVPAAWRTRTLTRICYDQLRSARTRREVYVGEWLPEPLPAPQTSPDPAHAAALADPADRVTLDETVSMALLVVLDRMTPAERVSFVLHDIFRFSFAEVAEIVGRTPQACRQLASTARQHAQGAERNRVSESEHRRLNEAFRLAWSSGDFAALVAVLDPDARAVTDGGGQVSAALEPLRGATAIAEFFAGVLERQPDLQVAESEVNGEPGLVGRAGGEIIAVLATAVRDGHITDIWAVRNPEKLRAWRSRTP